MVSDPGPSGLGWWSGTGACILIYILVWVTSGCSERMYTTVCLPAQVPVPVPSPSHCFPT